MQQINAAVRYTVVRYGRYAAAFRRQDLTRGEPRRDARGLRRVTVPVPEHAQDEHVRNEADHLLRRLQDANTSSDWLQENHNLLLILALLPFAGRLIFDFGLSGAGRPSGAARSFLFWHCPGLDLQGPLSQTGSPSTKSSPRRSWAARSWAFASRKRTARRPTR